MEFLDNALNKTKEAFDVAYKKAGEVVSSEKLKINISSLENKKEKDFAKLGKLYFESVKDEETVEEQYAQLVSDIKEKNEEIAYLKEQIQTIKNKKFCSQCGAMSETSAVYCSVCGKKFNSEEE